MAKTVSKLPKGPRQKDKSRKLSKPSHAKRRDPDNEPLSNGVMPRRSFGSTHSSQEKDALVRRVHKADRQKRQSQVRDELSGNQARPGHFRVARSMFGDYWVGLTDEAIDNRKTFGKLGQAVQQAVNLTEERTFSSDMARDCAIDDLRDTSEDDLDVVPKSARW